MSQTRNCPVCGRPGLPPDCGSCPQCDADLTCFQALDSLASPAAATVAAPPKKRRFPWAAAGVLALLALLLLAGLAASMKSRLSELDRQLAELKAAEARTATESKPTRQPVPAKPPESKIQIDARVRIVDEHAAAGSAAVEESKQPVVAAKEMKKIAAVQPGEERKPASDAAQAAAAQPVAGPVEQADAKSKVVREIIRQPDKEKDEPLGAPMPPPPAAKTAEQSAAAASEASEKSKEEQSLSVVADRPASEEGRDLAEIADPPATPPVLLKPGFRKHRVRPVVLREEIAQHPAVAAEHVGLTAAAQQRGGSFFYLIKDGETVWDIAERFYGDRKYYPVVMEQNPHIFLGFIRKNSTVRLFTDRREAAALYQRKIEQREGLLLWSYEVRPGETWRTIYARFFLPRYSGMIFYGNQDVAPGKTMLVILR
uniref:LysM peptidoglycan-binding domain-containing protein n=1 Tax=Candidatus Electronema sp. TaxID=2698783 RepID=UPI0040574461